MFLITGAKGQLGKCLAEVLVGEALILCDIEEMDISDMSSVQSYTEGKTIDAIINCAAYTNVDLAEDEKEKAFKINVTGTANLANFCACKNIPLIHISTDYIFGANPVFCVLNEETIPCPQSVYGISKLLGEEAIKKANCAYIIIRTAWLYSHYGHNFLKTILRLAQERKEIKVVADQIGTPTFAWDLALVIKTILKSGKKDIKNIKEIYNYTNQGVCSWYDFAVEIVRQKSLDCLVLPINTKEYPTKATRPFFSVLDKSKITKDFGLEINHWTKGVTQCLKKIS